VPSVCVCNCGLDVEDGTLCLDWQTVGMYRTCAVGLPYSNSLSGLSSSEEWFNLRDQSVAWTNATCRTHRVVVRVQMPYMLIKLGENNRWDVRGFLDGAVDSPVSYDGGRSPEMQWSSVWSGGMPVGTDQEQQSPGSAKREFIVPPGSTLTATGRIQARVPAYTPRPQNLLQFAGLVVSLSAWPSQVDSGVGRTC